MRRKLLRRSALVIMALSWLALHVSAWLFLPRSLYHEVGPRGAILGFTPGGLMLVRTGYEEATGYRLLNTRTWEDGASMPPLAGGLLFSGRSIDSGARWILAQEVRVESHARLIDRATGREAGKFPSTGQWGVEKGLLLA